MSLDSALNAIRSAVVTACGLPATSVIWLWQHGTGANLPFVALGVTSVDTFGLASVKQSDTESRRTEQRIVRMDVRVHSRPTIGVTSATQIAEQTALKLRTVEIRDVLQAADVGLLDVGVRTRLPKFMDDELEDIINFELVCNVAMVIDESILPVVSIGYTENVS